MQTFKTLTMKKLLFIGALIAMAGLSFQSCEKLSSINENPNEPSNVDAGVLFTEGVRSSVSTSVTQSYLLGNVASQLAAKTLRAVIGEYSWNAFPNTWNQNYASLGNIIVGIHQKPCWSNHHHRLRSYSTARKHRKLG